MMEVDMFETCGDRFDNILKGLMGMIMDKTIIMEEKYVILYTFLFVCLL